MSRGWAYVSPEFPTFLPMQDRLNPTTHVWPALAQRGTGAHARRRRLNPADFLGFEMPVPTMDVRLRLRKIRSRLDEVKRLQAVASADLDALLPSILDRDFKGEL